MGDFTIGDAWGVREHDSEFYSPDGVSLILVNSPSAVRIFEDAKQTLEYRCVHLEQYRQGNMQHPSEPHRSIEEFWKDYESKPFSYIVKKYANNHILLNMGYIAKNWKKLIKHD